MDITLTLTLSERLFGVSERLLAVAEALLSAPATKTGSVPAEAPRPVAAAAPELTAEEVALHHDAFDRGVQTLKDMGAVEHPRATTAQEAMDAARTRIEGPDWANSQSEGYQRWHKQMNAMFKKMANDIAGTKPTALTGEALQLFIEQAEYITIEGDELILKPF